MATSTGWRSRPSRTAGSSTRLPPTRRVGCRPRRSATAAKLYPSSPGQRGPGYQSPPSRLPSTSARTRPCNSTWTVMPAGTWPLWACQGRPRWSSTTHQAGRGSISGATGYESAWQQPGWRLGSGWPSASQSPVHWCWVLCVTSGWACYVLMTEGPAPPGTAGGARPTPQYLDVPDLVPARMVNAFVYCPRLFYLEWISSQFEPSVDTVEGDWVHRVTGQPTGAAPLPDAGELVAARSLLLSSERLGLVGRLDLVEGAGGGVVPVDTKKGTAPDLPEGAWESDRVQLCIQGMLLQDAGYECDHGFVYYAASRKRVRVSFDDQLRAKALSTVEQLRRVAAGGAVPEPLVDSPKCPRCSLVGICLPDEINALAKRAQRKPRRLVPSDPDPQPAYVTEPGAWVGKSGGRIEVTSSGQMLASFREIDASQLCLYGNVQGSSQVVRDLLADGAVICWFSYGGWFTGIATGLPSKYAALRLAQYAASTGERSLVLSQAITAGKIKNSRVLLRRNARGDVTGELAALQE